MTHVVVDPVTRIEGHLRLEAEVDGGSVKDAWSSSTMFRGIELILKGRDPRDAWVFTQRICGVCTTVHAIASIRAVENAIGAKPPPNARLLRNIIMASQAVQDHVVHFYHLHALDWVDVVSALSADPAKTSALAQSISTWPKSSTTYFAGVRDRVKAFVDRGQLGPFANAYWGHSAYKLPPEANLMAVAHYLEALDWQRDFIRVHAILGGKNPHLQGFLVGGVATPVDPDKQASLNAGTIAALKELVAHAKDFVTRVYIPDVLAVASFYKDWAAIGGGIGSYLVYGEYPDDDGPNPAKFLPGGVIWDKNLGKVEDFNPEKVSEYVTHSWYEYGGGDAKALHPSVGETLPNYTGPKPPYDRLHERQVQLAQVAALRGPTRRGRTPRADARRVRARTASREGARGRGARQAGRGARGAVLDAGSHRGPGHRDAGAGREARLLGGPAGSQHEERGPAHARQRALGSVHLAEGLLRRGLPRGAAGRARALGAHPRGRDRQLPVHRAQHLERGPARRQRTARRLRGGPDGNAGGRSREAAGDPADGALVRSVHGLR